jgi:hypothetical protein
VARGKRLERSARLLAVVLHVDEVRVRLGLGLGFGIGLGLGSGLGLGLRFGGTA